MKPLVATWWSLAGSRLFWRVKVGTLGARIDAGQQWLVSADNSRRPDMALDRETIEVLGWHEACFSSDRPEQSGKEKVPC